MWLWWLLWDLRLILLGIELLSPLSSPAFSRPAGRKKEPSFDGLVMAKLPPLMHCNVGMMAAVSYLLVL